MDRYTSGFAEPACADPRQFGGKAAGLAGLVAIGLPVPDGFAVSASAYQVFLAGSGVAGSGLAGLLAVPGSGADRLAERLAGAPVPPSVAAEIRDRYQQLCQRAGVDDLPVAVRSSATAEDSPSASFAGEYESWVDVAGADQVIEHVRRCWSSVFAVRAMDYAAANGLNPTGVQMAVVIQRTVRARAAGVMFTISPVSGDRSRMVVEAGWGLGLAVVGGEITPDRWVIDKVGLRVLDFSPGDKRIEYRCGAGAEDVEPARWAQPCLTEAEVRGLARLGKQLERHHGAAQDIEFAVDSQRLDDADGLTLLQCRPETVWSSRHRAPRFDAELPVTSWISQAVSGASLMPGGQHDHRSVG